MSGIKAPGLGPPVPVEGWELVHTYPSFLTSCWDSLKVFYLVSSGVPSGMETRCPHSGWPVNAARVGVSLPCLTPFPAPVRREESHP